jgi:hypothetical protein
MPIRDRIIEFRRVRADQLRPHPRNWRTHPTEQRAALQAALDEIGFAGALLVREQPDGSLELIDGHLRAELAPEMLVPVLLLDVNEAEADLLLATFDPISAMAGKQAEQLDQLLAQVTVESPSLRSLLEELSADPEISRTDAPEREPIVPDVFQIVIECADESAQRETFDRLTRLGYECRLSTL